MPFILVLFAFIALDLVFFCTKLGYCLQCLTLLVGRKKGHLACKKWGGWRGALVSTDGVAPSQIVSVSASVNLPLHHKVQKFLFWHHLTRVVPEKGLWCGGGGGSVLWYLSPV